MDRGGRGFRLGREVRAVTEMSERTEKRPRRFRPYPEYRDSGVEWLGEIPAHWNVRRLKNIASVQLSNVDKKTVEGQAPVKLCNYVDVYYNDFITAGLKFMTATATPDQVRRFRLRTGDVLITKDSESWNDIAVPAVVVEEQADVLCGYHLAHIKPQSGLDGRFLARQFSATGIRDQFHLAANGITRFGLGGDAIRSGLFPTAPIDEQQVIADFLDRETAKIDALIARKERLIELLQEKRIALITHAVTRGLDPNVPMMDSGVEWLGETPAHWAVKPVIQTAEILRGKFTHRPRNDPSLYDGRYPFIQTGEVARASKVITSYRQTLNEQGLAVSKLFPAGTLVMTIAANIGDVAVLDFAACFPDSIVGFVPRDGVHRDYLYYVFLAMKPELLREAPVNTQGNLNIERIGSQGTRAPLPGVVEQRAIAAFLDRKTAKIDLLCARVQTAIDHLHEIRTALISAAVTGRIDVREYAS